MIQKGGGLHVVGSNVGLGAVEVVAPDAELVELGQLARVGIRDVLNKDKGKRR